MANSERKNIDLIGVTSVSHQKTPGFAPPTTKPGKLDKGAKGIKGEWWNRYTRQT